MITLAVQIKFDLLEHLVAQHVIKIYREEIVLSCCTLNASFSM